MPKLTETFAKSSSYSSKGTAKHWDTEVRGFGLFIGKRSKTWYFQKDVGGETKRVLIGRYPAVNAKFARQTALGYSLEWGRGSAKRIAFGAPTLEDATEAYLARGRLRSETHKLSVRQQFSLHLSDWLRLPLDEITKGMVAQRHASLSHIPSGANHVLKYFRTVYNHARRTYELPDNPTLAVEWYEERPKGDVIEDLVAWKYLIDSLENPIHASFFRLLLFTGLRKSEALNLEWPHVRSDHIHIPMTKNGRSFDLPALDKHHEILEPMRGLHGRWVFPSPKGPDNRLSAPKRIQWSPHSHRRTFATVAMEAGVLEEIVGRLLNHTPISITGQRYVKPSLEALRPSMETVCTELEARMQPAAQQG